MTSQRNRKQLHDCVLICWLIFPLHLDFMEEEISKMNYVRLSAFFFSPHYFIKTKRWIKSPASSSRCWFFFYFVILILLKCVHKLHCILAWLNRSFIVFSTINISSELLCVCVCVRACFSILSRCSDRLLYVMSFICSKYRSLFFSQNVWIFALECKAVCNCKLKKLKKNSQRIIT